MRRSFAWIPRFVVSLPVLLICGIAFCLAAPFALGQYLICLKSKTTKLKKMNV